MANTASVATRSAIPQTTPGDRLRAVREAQGKGLRETARKAKINPAHLSRVEHGKSGLSVDSLARLARVLGLRDLSKTLRPFTNGKPS